MAVSFEALAMAGADHLDYKVDIEEWEKKYMLNPPPHLLSPKSRQRETSSHRPLCNRPLFFCLTKQQKNKEGKVCHFSSEEEMDNSSDDDDATVWDTRKKGSMVEGLKFMGRIVKLMTRKIRKFFSITVKKKKKSQV